MRGARSDAKRVWLDRFGWTGQIQTTDVQPSLDGATEAWNDALRSRSAPLDCVAPIPRAFLLGRPLALTSPMDWQLGSTQAFAKQQGHARRELHKLEFLACADDALFESVVTDWIEQHPQPERGRWRDAWHPRAISARAAQWMHRLGSRQDGLSEEFRRRAAASLGEQLEFLSRNVDLEHETLARVQGCKALLLGGRFFSGSNAQAWKRQARAVLREELDELSGPDGVVSSSSPSEQGEAVRDLLACWEHAGDLSLAARIESLLGPMAQALVDLTHPDGQHSQFFQRGELEGASSAECLDLLERTLGSRPQARPEFAFRSAGLYGVRSAQGYFVARYGAHPKADWPAGGDADLLSFEWSLLGRRMIVDPGLYERVDGEWSAWSRSTMAHNTVSLGRADQIPFRGRGAKRAAVRCQVERWEQVGPSRVIDGWHDGYKRLRGAPIHQRRIVVGQHGFEVQDRIVGGAGQSCQARLLLHPDVSVIRREHALYLVSGEAVAALETEVPATVEEAWWFPRPGSRRRTRQLVLEYGPAPTGGGFRLLASRPEFEWTAFLERVRAMRGSAD